MTDLSIEELLNMSDDERRHLIMTTFGTVFPEVQNLIVKLSIASHPSLTTDDVPVILQALYLASIEYTRYWNEFRPDGEALH